MAGADADRITMRISEEETFGTAPTGNVTATITTTQASKLYAAAAGLDVFSVGQMVLIAGMVNSDSNGYKTVVSASATEMVVEEAIGANEAAVGSVTIDTAYEDLRITGESLGLDTTTQESAEIEDSGNVTEIRRTNRNSTGDINFEFSYGNFDKLLEGAWRSSWSTAVTDTQITFSMDSADNSINDSGSGFVAAGYTANQWIQTSGFTTAANNGYFKIVSVAAGKMVLSYGTVVTEAAGDTVTVLMGGQLVNGTTEKSYSIERQYNDLTTDIVLYTGNEIDGLTLDGSADGVMTGSFSIMGQDASSETTSKGSGTAKIANTNPSFSGIDDVEGIFENGTAISLSNLSLSVANGIRPRNVMGTLGPESMGRGRFNLTGSYEKFYASEAIMDKYLNFTSTSLALVIVDDNGNGYVIELPEMKYTNGRRVAGGTESDIVAAMEFKATRDSSELITARITRFAA